MDSLENNSVQPGLPEKISHVVRAVTKDKVLINLSWNHPQVQENHKIEGYRVSVFEERLLPRNSPVYDRFIAPERTDIDLELKTDQRYSVMVSTTLYLGASRTMQTSKKYEISTDLSKTIHCQCKDDAVKIFWQPVNGASKYHILVKDQHNCSVYDGSTLAMSAENRCSTKIKMSGELQIGKRCSTKVIVHLEGGKTFESDWKTHLLGGTEVPQNVEVTKNPENPDRSVAVSFDSPAKGPANEYKITAIPALGLKSSICVKGNLKVFEYLRQGVEYKFEVRAKWGNNWSKGSLSSPIRTAGDCGKAAINSHDPYKTIEDLTNAVLAGHTADINKTVGEDFGRVRDLKLTMKASGDTDIMTLKWSSPDFGRKTEDVQVKLYSIEVAKNEGTEAKSQTIKVEKSRTEYESRTFELKLGQAYKVVVSTVYLDIDQDSIFKSSVAREVHARPGAPSVTRNDCSDNSLVLEWSETTGARCYRLELYVVDEPGPELILSKELGKKTICEEKFDKGFGHGTSYFAVVTSIGTTGKENFSQTPTKTIGGDYIPTNVVVISNHPKVADRKSQVYLSWTRPKRPPEQYQISSFPQVETMEAVVADEECLVSGLKAGVEYCFQVKAFHWRDGRRMPSSSRLSAKIRTWQSTIPRQVRKVWTKPGGDQSTSVEIYWQKADPEKLDEIAKYRVNLFKDDYSAKREVLVEKEMVIMRDLDPGSTYFVTVASGNSIGYGRDSEIVRLSTKLGKPKNVILQNNMEKLASSAIVKFSRAEGQPLKYVGTLYKCMNELEVATPRREIESGYCFDNLEPNTEYLIKLNAYFSAGEGEIVESKPLLTAPSKTRITDFGCIHTNGAKSSREIFVKWNSDVGCTIHEIRVTHAPTSTLESQLVKQNENEVKYICLNESTTYSIQVRSLNKSGHFGDWSNEALIELAPAQVNIMESSGIGSHPVKAVEVRWEPLAIPPSGHLVKLFCDGCVLEEVTTTCASHVFKENLKPGSLCYCTVSAFAGAHGKIVGIASRSRNYLIALQEIKFSNCLETILDNPVKDFELEWKPLTPAPVGYVVKLFCNDREVAEIVTTDTSHFFKDELKPGSICHCTVAAFAGDHERKVTGKASKSRNYCIDFPNIQNLKCDLKGSLIKATWGEITECTWYEVEVFTKEKVEAHLKVQEVEYEHLCHMMGTVYSIRIRPCNNEVLGSWSEPVSIMSALPNLTQVIVTKSDFEPTKRLIVEFRDPDCQSKEYIVSAKAKSDGQIVTQKTRQHRYGLHGLRPGETYEVFVRAEFQNEVSETAYAPEPVQTVPEKVTGIHFQSTDEKNIVRWSRPAFPCQFRVEWQCAGKEKQESSVKLGQCFYEWQLDLMPGVKHEVRVRAENTAGPGEWSESITMAAAGERRENVGQARTEMYGDADSFIGSAGNVHHDRSTHTKMENVKVLSVSFPGITSGPSDTLCLQQNSGTAQAIKDALAALDSSAMNDGTPSTSRIALPPRSIQDEQPSAGEGHDCNTVPKTSGLYLDDEAEASEGGDPNDSDAENYESPGDG